ncbi:prophage side tail fiber protein homolog StfR-like [Hordeum vulgare subsp. vulgare]|uniref:Uncharacterized protein n=2 Tax=Hordeum vulgare subsp. vulgare TaxID=112509 RepID=A0A8I6W742_HORVV|nr:prophage side tail fiber protein homolog StfR-like [Hordeum vulgare subsp. vulgare]
MLEMRAHPMSPWLSSLHSPVTTHTLVTGKFPRVRSCAEQNMDGRGAAPPPASRICSWHVDDESELGEEELGVFTAERYFNGALAAEEALWCDRSSSSFSSVFKTWQHDGSAPTPTAATSSSEASWNSRCALLPNRPAVAAPSPVESKPEARTESDQTGRKARPSSSHLRRWLLGMAGRACAWGDGEESVSTDDLSRHELEAGTGSAHGVQKRSTEADAALPRMTSKQTALEGVTATRVMSGKWVDDGDEPLTVPVAEATHSRAANSMTGYGGNPAANASYNDRLRRESLDMFQFHQAGQGSAITIVAGSTAQGGAASAGGGARGSPDSPNRRRDSGDLESMCPPSEASVVWSVVTAEGAASGNFSSAASGCYYYFDDGDGETARQMAAGGKINRRRRSNGSRLLMGCMSKRAADAVGPGSDARLPAGGRAGADGEVSGPDMTRRR